MELPVFPNGGAGVLAKAKQSFHRRRNAEGIRMRRTHDSIEPKEFLTWKNV
jgi:hypothetical protein